GRSAVRSPLVKFVPLEIGPPFGLESVAGLAVGRAHETAFTARERIVLDRRVSDEQGGRALSRGRLCLAHRPIGQLACPVPAKPLFALRVKHRVLRVDMTPERLRVANGEGSKPDTIVFGLRL